jgi:ketosteroid isomerase-like protein
VVGRFLELQRAMYAGGGVEPVVGMLAPDVLWHVPGRSPIAGEYAGREAVLGYFTTRRRLAGGAMKITKHAELAGEDVLVQLADGSAWVDGEELTWRTAGVYRVAGGQIAEAWLVPLDSAAFDRAWQRLAARYA